MANGYSFESFAAKCDVSVVTLYNWAKSNKDFLNAKRRGEAKSLAFFEQMGKVGMLKTGFNSTLWIFQMKCRFHKYGFNPENQNISFAEEDDETGFEFVTEPEKSA